MTHSAAFQPGDEVITKDGRAGLLYALIQNGRWIFLPARVGTRGTVVTSQLCTVSALDIERCTGRPPGIFWDLR